MIRILAALIALASPACAEGIPCQPAPDLIQLLADRWGEGVLATGTGGNEQRVIVTINPDTGTWTIVAVRPDGLACAVGSGTEWRMLRPGAPA